MRTSVALFAALTFAALTTLTLGGPPHPFGSQVPIHGRLAPLDNDVPTPDGNFEFEYEVFDAMSGGNSLGSASTADVDVINGVFFDAPNFGEELFTGAGPRFIEVRIRPAGSSDEFVTFQRIEVKPHPRAQVAGEIFLPASTTATTNAGTAALKITNDGQGGAAAFNSTDPARVDPVVSITAATNSSSEALKVTGKTLITGTFKAGGDDQFATFVVDEFGTLVDADLQVTGKATFNGAVNFNGPIDINDLIQATSAQPISNALGTMVVSNTHRSGRALLAFNMQGGEGMFGSSIGGTGVVAEGTGNSSTGMFAFSNTGRAAVFQTTNTGSLNSTMQIVNQGLNSALNIQGLNTGSSSHQVQIVCTNSNAPGLLNTGRSALVGSVSLGGTFASTNPLQHSSGAHLSAGGTFVNASSRALKENFEPVDARDVLERLSRLPISTWNYRAERDGARHIGPTAEDFAELFGLGGEDTTIGTVDADGIALAAIQELHRSLQQKDAEIALLHQRLARLEAISTRHDGNVQD